MNKQRIIRQLTWYEKIGDNLVGECELKNISISELQKLFGQPNDDLMLYCYQVNIDAAKYLQKFVIHQINLDKYDYFVESYNNN